MKYQRKDIPTFEGKYAADTNGEIWSLNYRGTGKVHKMKKKIHKDEHYHITIRVNGKRQTFAVHRLVASTFIGDIEGKTIDHIDTNPLNNNVDNLRICTQKQNNNNPLSYAKRCKRVREVCNKSVILRGVKDGSVLEFSSRIDAAKYFGKEHGSYISNVLYNAKRKGKTTVIINGEEFYYEFFS